MPNSIFVSIAMHPTVAAMTAAPATTAVHLHIDGATASAAALARGGGTVSSSRVAGAIAVGFAGGD